MKINEIRKNLNDIDALYNAHPLPTNNAQQLYSKLATIELSSWVEFAMDEMVIAYWAKHSTMMPKLYKEFKDEIVKKNHGFNYATNFRPMLYKTIGLASVHKIESLYPADIDILETTLKTLSVARNDAAHKFFHAGMTLTMQSPSVTLSLFEQLHPILTKIRKQVLAVRKIR